MVMRLTDADREKVGAAVSAAEAGTNGEIVTVATPISDSYRDVALEWAVAMLILALAWAAWWPAELQWWYAQLFGGWSPDPTLGRFLTFIMILAVMKFVGVLLILSYRPLRLALTPGATKHRRVRRRAITIFKAAAERRTAGRTGILIYLSLAERRAEIIADEAILKVTKPETWGEAMAVMLEHLREGRAGEGIAAAVERVGHVLKEHFPKSSGDTNELPDALIEL
jgi:putative membrane protein